MTATNQIIHVAIGIVMAEDGKVLITKRKADAVLGGLWEFPGGKIESGETAEVCVVREIMEEVGLPVRVVEPLETIEHTYDHGHVVLQPLLCQPVEGEAIPIEVAELRWALPATLNADEFPPANAPLLAMISDL